MENSVKNLIQFIDHSPSCFHVIENARKQFLGTWFYGIKRERILGFGGRKKLLCYERNGSSTIAFHLAKERFSRISHRGKPQ